MHPVRFIQTPLFGMGVVEPWPWRLDLFKDLRVQVDSSQHLRRSIFRCPRFSDSKCRWPSLGSRAFRGALQYPIGHSLKPICASPFTSEESKAKGFNDPRLGIPRGVFAPLLERRCVPRLRRVLRPRGTVTASYLSVAVWISSAKVPGTGIFDEGSGFQVPLPA